MDPLQAILAEMKAMRAAMSAVAKENADLREAQTQREGIGFADGIPANRRSHDPNTRISRDNAARSVTIATRPVVERPEDYDGVVDGGMVGNHTLRDVLGDDYETRQRV